MGVAVVTPEGIVTRLGHFARPRHIGAADLAHRAIDRGIEDLFYDYDPPPSYWQDGAGKGDFPPDGSHPLRGRYVTGRGAVFIHDARQSDWLEPPAAIALAACDDALAALRCNYLGYSPAWRGMQLLNRTRALHREWFDYPNPPEGGKQHDRPPDFITPPCGRYDGHYLHIYDMRAAYPAAARSVVLGWGETTYTRTFNPRAAGLWNVTLPSPVTVGPITAPGTYDTATVRAQLHLNLPCTILGGRVFTAHATVLRQWSERMAEARAALDGNPAALALVKKVWTRTLGRLANPKSEWAYHPQWWYAIVAESGRRVWYQIKDRPEVIGAATDTIIVRSTDPNPATAYPPYGARTTTGPGTLRHVGMVEWSRGIADLASTAGSGGRFMRELESRHCLYPYTGGA